MRERRQVGRESAREAKRAPYAPDGCSQETGYEGGLTHGRLAAGRAAGVVVVLSPRASSSRVMLRRLATESLH